MAEIPDEMKSNGRDPDPIFSPDEELYRRFAPADFDEGKVALEAFELPDMSVGRQKYGRAEWLLLVDGLEGWGVGAFEVNDIPSGAVLLHLGVQEYLLRAVHMPDRYNYPHTEVQVFRDRTHISLANNNVDLLNPEFHIRWRERLSESSWIKIQPKS